MADEPRYETIDDDADERLDDEPLEASRVQKILWPLYLLILVVGLCIASVPFLILWTVVDSILMAQEY